MRIYIAGPMRGYEHLNFASFDDAAARGRALGHEIVSPADMDRTIGVTEEPDEITPEFLQDVVKRDLAEVLKCDAIALLEGWEKSKGAMAEYSVAVWLNKGILDARTFQAYTNLQPDLAREFHHRDGSRSSAPRTTVDLKDFPCLWPGCEGRTLIQGLHCDLEHDARAEISEIKNGEFVVKDSGSRQVFSTGAQRDCGDAKGYYHLIPMVAVEREAQLYEAGARKYGKDNWRKGIPLSRFIDSAFRHLFKLAGGWKDEDHAAAVRWNVGCFMETEKRIADGSLPAELDDLAGKGLK